MNHLLFVLLSFAGFLSLKEEKDSKRKQVVSVLYVSMVGIALVYHFGEFIGGMLYQLLHV